MSLSTLGKNNLTWNVCLTFVLCIFDEMVISFDRVTLRNDLLANDELCWRNLDVVLHVNQQIQVMGELKKAIKMKSFKPNFL
jgi:hypothetical protein